MNAEKIKVLSCIKNLRKIIFACPRCLDNNSIILPQTIADTQKHRCDSCRQSYDMDLSDVKPFFEN